VNLPEYKKNKIAIFTHLGGAGEVLLLLKFSSIRGSSTINKKIYLKIFQNEISYLKKINLTTS
jgi:hypothetical protein